MFISQMHTPHLLNTIKAALRRLEAAFQICEAEEMQNTRRALVYGLDWRKAKKQAQQAIPVILEWLDPYFAELFLRAPLTLDETNVQGPLAIQIQEVQTHLRALLQRQDRDSLVGFGDVRMRLDGVILEQDIEDDSEVEDFMNEIIEKGNTGR